MTSHRSLLVVSLVFACNQEILTMDAPALPVMTAIASEGVPCLPPASYGAIPDDGLDDRAGLQATLDACAGQTVNLLAGRYDVFTPPLPRPAPYAMLVMRPWTEIVGVGDASVVAFSGDPQKEDWRGVELATGAHLHRFRPVVEICAGCTNEQTHVLRGQGPISDITIDHMSFYHPVVVGSSRGDCIQIVGYAPAKLVERVTIDHNRFDACARAAYTWHSGARQLKITYNTMLDVSDQSLDGEGQDESGAPLISDSEIAYNVIQTGPSAAGGGNLGVQIVRAENLHVHDNQLLGRGMDVAGCVHCEFNSNVVTQDVYGEDAAVMVRKGCDDVWLHDEKYTRSATAGARAVLAVQQRISAPKNVRITDSQIIQHTASIGIYSQGVVGFLIANTVITYDGGSNAQYCVDLAGTELQTTDLHITDSLIRGACRAIRISGAAGGTGTLEVARTATQSVSLGLRCEQTVVAPPKAAGINGPIRYYGNVMPAATCGAVPFLNQ